MAYCQHCGTEISANGRFCEHCGTPVGALSPVQQGVPGRGLAIASLIFGIISGVIGLEVLLVSALVPRIPGGAFLIFFPIYAMFPATALIFASVARKKGYKRALSRVGLYLGIASLCLMALAVPILLVRGALA